MYSKDGPTKLGHCQGQRWWSKVIISLGESRGRILVRSIVIDDDNDNSNGNDDDDDENTCHHPLILPHTWPGPMCSQYSIHYLHFVNKEEEAETSCIMS